MELSDLPPDYREQAERQLREGRASRVAAPVVVERPVILPGAPKSELEEAFVTLRRQLAPWLPEPERGHEFAREPNDVLPRPRKWALDFAWRPELVAVEVEGGVTRASVFDPKRRGRHARPEGFGSDAAKYNAAQVLGWMILRCTGKTLATDPDEFFRLVSLAIAKRRSIA
jgi:hypothetical protein